MMSRILLGLIAMSTDFALPMREPHHSLQFISQWKQIGHVAKPAFTGMYK